MLVASWERMARRALRKNRMRTWAEDFVNSLRPACKDPRAMGDPKCACWWSTPLFEWNYLLVQDKDFVDAVLCRVNNCCVYWLAEYMNEIESSVFEECFNDFFSRDYTVTVFIPQSIITRDQRLAVAALDNCRFHGDPTDIFSKLKINAWTFSLLQRVDPQAWHDIGEAWIRHAIENTTDEKAALAEWLAYRYDDILYNMGMEPESLEMVLAFLQENSKPDVIDSMLRSHFKGDLYIVRSMEGCDTFSSVCDTRVDVMEACGASDEELEKGLCSCQQEEFAGNKESLSIVEHCHFDLSLDRDICTLLRCAVLFGCVPFRNSRCTVSNQLTLRRALRAHGIEHAVLSRDLSTDANQHILDFACFSCLWTVLAALPRAYFQRRRDAP